MASGTSPSQDRSEPSDTNQRPADTRRSPRELRRIALSVILFAFVFHSFVLPVFSNFGKTWKTLATLNLGVFLIAIAVEGVAWYFASESTRLLLPANRRPSRLFMYEANLAANGVSEVLPGGVAATAVLDYGLLRKVGVEKDRIVFALGAAGIVGVVTMIGLAAISVLATASQARRIQGGVIGAVAAITILALVAAAGWALVKRTPATARVLGKAVGWIPGVHRHGVEDWVSNTADQLRELLTDRRRLAHLATVTSAQWTAECASAWVVFASLGHHVNPFELFVAYAIAVGMGAVPISPGGLGVFEGTMIAVLVVFGVEHATATAGVLAFRLINYWLPIPLGAFAYWLADRSAGNTTAHAG